MYVDVFIKLQITVRGDPTQSLFTNLFNNFVHAIMYINYDISRHDTVWIVDDQLCVVEGLAWFSVHAVISIWRVGHLHVITENCVFFPGENLHQEHCAVCLDSLGVVVTLRGVGGKVETVTETLEVYVPPDEFPEHPELTDSTYPAVLVITGALCVDNVTLQLGPVVVFLDSFKVTWKSHLISIPPCLQLWVDNLESASDSGTDTLPGAPLTAEVRLNLTKF